MPLSKPQAVVVDRATSPEARAACFAIRRAVFVTEQRIDADIEFDELDDTATHYLANVEGIPVATARVVDYSPKAKIGRVAVLPKWRGRRIGEAIMKQLLDDAANDGYLEAVLHSQTTALPFYERLGFTAEGAEFLEADIPHFRMRRTLP